jgi:trimeric autotransporter adhesin
MFLKPVPSILLLASTSVILAQYNIQTIAGAGKLPVPGDGISAISELRLVQPTAIGSDRAGTVYIVDPYFQAILRVAPDGSVTRLAGTGEDGFSGDGGPATEARFRNPSAVLGTASGDVYVSDASNGRIRRIDADGNISTFAGTGALARAGDGGPAANAAIGNPNGMALDSSGNFYFSDPFNHVVRRIDGQTGIITTVAGSGTVGFSGDNGPATSARLQRPLGITLDASGNLFIADSANNRIRRVDAASGIITTVAGTSQTGFSGDNGPAVNAWLFAPNDVKSDPSGNGDLYIADGSNGRIRRIRNGVITTVAGGGATAAVTPPLLGTRAALGAVSGLVFLDEGNLVTAETGAKRLRALQVSDGELRLFAGQAWEEAPGDGLPGTSGSLLAPMGVAVDSSTGSVFIADLLDHRVRVLDSEGIIRTYAGNGTLAATTDGGSATGTSVSQPQGLAIDSLGHLYISTPSRIRRVTPLSEGGGITTYAGTSTVGFGGDEGPAIAARVNFPQCLVFDADDNLYFADTTNHRVRKVIRATGVIVTVAGNGTNGYSGDDGPAVEASLSSPRGVALDAEGNLYISDSLNHRVRKVEAATGIIRTIAGTGVLGAGPNDVPALESRLNTPAGIAFDPQGNLVVAHGGSGQIRKIAMDTGIISTIAGVPAPSYGGDGGPATAAGLNFPSQIAITPDGRIFVADRMNARVRLLTPVVTEDK